MNTAFTERCVLLTGAGGSIGSALAKATLARRPRSLILLDHSEGNLHQINFDLSLLPGSRAVCPIIGDVCDEALLTEIFEERKPETIIHAAAFKHVPLMENNPISAVQNNGIGTCLLAERARIQNVPTFIMVSTDKAVNPHSVMGASKRLAELALLRWSSSRSSMRAVRLGNVLDSQGSVVPIFRQQISKGGPVTVTHPLVDRYFLNLNDAVDLVVLAANLNAERGIFVPSPRKPVRILDLAERLIKEAGFEAQGGIPIVMTGLRPGDKMTEEFVSDLESVDWADNARLHLVDSPQPSPEEFDSSIATLKNHVARRNLVGTIEELCRIVPEYRPSETVLESLRERQSICP